MAMSNTTTKRQSAEARRNAKAQRAYESIRYVGANRNNDMVEDFTVASASEPGTRYPMHHETVSGMVWCGCPAGDNHHHCYHVDGLNRWLYERAEKLNAITARAVELLARAEADARAQMEADARRDTAPLHRSGFSFMAR